MKENTREEATISMFSIPPKSINERRNETIKKRRFSRCLWAVGLDICVNNILFYFSLFHEPDIYLPIFDTLFFFACACLLAALKSIFKMPFTHAFISSRHNYRWM